MHHPLSNGGRPTAKLAAECQAGEAEARWQAVLCRTRSADGCFFYSVETTGVYCYPSCSARRPRREHVAFHATAAAAEAAGFRPCKRCRPNEPPHAQRQAWLAAKLCRFIEQRAVAPSLQELADQVGLSTFHVHRVFKKCVGVTPKAYAAAHHAKRFLAELAQGGSVTRAIYSAGYRSSGRFYETSTARLGMAPHVYRKGAQDLEIRFAVGECSLGSILVAATARGVCAILLGDDPAELANDLERRFPRAELRGGDADFERWVACVVGLVEEPSVRFVLPLDIRGTAFQQRVWQALRRIPLGTTATYAEVARSLGAPNAARAVAGACASNALAVAIPCHRVVRTDGILSGYRWGVERKRALLERETASILTSTGRLFPGAKPLNKRAKPCR